TMQATASASVGASISTPTPKCRPTITSTAASSETPSSSQVLRRSIAVVSVMLGPLLAPRADADGRAKQHDDGPDPHPVDERVDEQAQLRLAGREVDGLHRGVDILADGHV